MGKRAAYFFGVRGSMGSRIWLFEGLMDRDGLPLRVIVTTEGRDRRRRSGRWIGKKTRGRMGGGEGDGGGGREGGKGVMGGGRGICRILVVL